MLLRGLSCVSKIVYNKNIIARNLSNYHLTGKKDDKFLVIRITDQFYFRYQLLNNRNNDNINRSRDDFVELTSVKYEEIVGDTLESLYDQLEETIESDASSTIGSDADVTLSDGILVLKLGNRYGTYVINKQSPNKQIWLSSPSSGPKRYDFVLSNQCWIYRHDRRTMHDLLEQELSEIFSRPIDLSRCLYSGSDRSNK